MSTHEEENPNPWSAGPRATIVPRAEEHTIDAVSALGEVLMPWVDLAASAAVQRRPFSPEIVWLKHDDGARFAVVVLDEVHADTYVEALKVAEAGTSND